MMLIKKILYIVFIFVITITVAYASENNTEYPADMAISTKDNGLDNGPIANASTTVIAKSDNVGGSDGNNSASAMVNAERNEKIVKDANGTTVISNASAFAYSEGKGDNLTLVSRAYAEGNIVRGAGGSYVEGSQTSADVSISVKALGNGLNSLTVVSYASGLNAIGFTWAYAWAENIERFARVTENVRNTGFAGFLFGKSDTERYTYFKFQSINLSAKNETVKRAKYWMEVIADDYGLNQTQFENKYNIETNKFAGVELVGIKKNLNENVVMVTVKVNGTLYDIPYGTESIIEGKKINITRVNETNNIVGMKVMNLKAMSK